MGTDTPSLWCIRDREKSGRREYVDTQNESKRSIKKPLHAAERKEELLMKARYSVLILTCLVLTSCASAAPTQVLTPTPTEGVTTSGIETGGSTIGVEGEPATFTWTQKHEFDWISTGTATTCDGKHWNLELTAELSIPEPKGDYFVSGSLDFEVDEKGSIGDLLVPVEGELVVANGTAALEDEIKFSLKFIDDGKAVEITLASNNTGTIDYGGGEIEEFGVIYPNGPVITATLMPYDGCSSP